MSGSRAADELEGGGFTAVEGREGWLFLDVADGVDVPALYADPEVFSESMIMAWKRLLERRRRHFEGTPAQYLTFVVPDAHLVYADKLPDGVTLAPESPFERLRAALPPAVLEQCVYPRDELVARRAQGETYLAVDSHWSDWGAWIGYRKIVAALASRVPGLRVLEESDLIWSERPVFGELGSAREVERSVQARCARIKEPRASVVKTVTTEVRRTYQVLEQDAPDLPVAVIVRDSFMTAAIKYFAESFRRLVLVNAPNALLYDLIEQEKPDVVIHELAERSLVRPPVEPSMAGFRSMYGDLLLDDPDAMADQRRSRSLFRNGRYDEAMTANDDVLARVPRNARVMVHRARLHQALERPEAAVESLRHATSLDPRDGGTWFFLGQALDALQRQNQALEAYRTACMAEPGIPDYWAAAVSALLRARRESEALQLAMIGMQRQPDSAKVAHAAATVLVAVKKIAEAALVAQRAVALEPTNPLYLRHLVQILLSARQPAARSVAEVLRVVAGDDPESLGYLESVKEALAALPGPDDPKENE